MVKPANTKTDTTTTTTPNQRADVKNPNNSDFKAAADNRSNQLNPNNAATKPSGNAPAAATANETSSAGKK